VRRRRRRRRRRRGGDGVGVLVRDGADELADD
jgi:hypothetical protein